MMVCGGHKRVGLMDADGDQRHAPWVTLCWECPKRHPSAAAHI